MSNNQKQMSLDEFYEVANPIEIAVFEGFISQTDYHEKTLEQYRVIFLMFYNWYRNNTEVLANWRNELRRNNRALIVNFFEMDSKYANDYIHRLTDAGLSNGYIATHRSTLSMWYDFAIYHYGESHPSARNVFKYDTEPITVPKSTKNKDRLTQYDVSKLEKYYSERNNTQKLAFLFFLIDTGCNRHECLELKKEVAYYVKDTDKLGREYKYYYTNPITRGGRDEYIYGTVRRPISQKTMNYFKKWVKEREESGLEDLSDAMFVKVENGKYLDMKEETLTAWIKGFSRVLNKRISFSTFSDSGKNTVSSDVSKIRVVN